MLAQRERRLVLGHGGDGARPSGRACASARCPCCSCGAPTRAAPCGFWRDSWHYLRALHDFRGEVGLSRRTKSPIYWTGHGYNLVMRLLYGAEYGRTAAAVAARIPDAASVVEVCCGTARLYQDFLRARGCRYLGLDFNGDFVMHARRRGVDVRWFDLLAEPIPHADYVVMCSSLYHFGDRADEIDRAGCAAAATPRGDRLGAGAQPVAARRSSGRLAAALTNPASASSPGDSISTAFERSRAAPRRRGHVRRGRPQRHRGVSARGVKHASKHSRDGELLIDAKI